MIRIDAIRELRRDLHMRPFEADRRVYLILSAQLMNEDAADALLKDLEEPPSYAVIVLVADDLGLDPRDDPLALPARAVHPPLRAGDPGGDRRCVRPSSRGAEARGACARRRRPARPARAASRPERGSRRRETLLAQARAVYARARLRARRRGGGAARVARASGAPRRRSSRRSRCRGSSCLPARPSSASSAPSAAPSARSFSRSSRSSPPGTATSSSSASAPRQAAIHVDRLEQLRADATRERVLGAERAAEAVRETWRRLEEFNLAPQLALEALFVEVAESCTPDAPVPRIPGAAGSLSVPWLLLLLKLTITPAVIALATVVARRFGPAVGGWLIGLPFTNGPVALFLTLEHGPRFTAHVARGFIAGISGEVAFVLAYVALVRRGHGWPSSLLVGHASPTRPWEPRLRPRRLRAVVLFACALGSASRSASGSSRRAARRRSPSSRWELPARMALATTLVVSRDRVRRGDRPRSQRGRDDVPAHVEPACGLRPPRQRAGGRDRRVPRPARRPVRADGLCRAR